MSRAGKSGDCDFSAWVPQAATDRRPVCIFCIRLRFSHVISTLNETAFSMVVAERTEAIIYICTQKQQVFFLHMLFFCTHAITQIVHVLLFHLGRDLADELRGLAMLGSGSCLFAAVRFDAFSLPRKLPVSGATTYTSNRIRSNIETKFPEAVIYYLF